MTNSQKASQYWNKRKEQEKARKELVKNQNKSIFTIPVIREENIYGCNGGNRDHS